MANLMPCTTGAECETFNVIPLEYQGWVFLIFLIFAFLALVVGIYLISTGYWIKKDTKQKPKQELEKKGVNNVQKKDSK